ncbi:MAG: HAD family hydrolase [Promethearchaeota archaeon]
MTIKAIVWDLDGTLIHFKIDYIRARREAIKILKKYGIPKKYLTIQDSILDNINKAKDYLKKNNVNPKEIDHIVKEVDKKVIEVERDAAIKATPLDGIKDVLKFIKEQGIKQAVYTINTKKNAKISLKSAGLLEFFDIIIGRDDVENIKPHPDHLIKICNELGVKSSEILVVGDTHRDITGAINIGAPSIAIISKISKLKNIDTLYKANKVIEEEEIPLKLKNLINELINL